MRRGIIGSGDITERGWSYRKEVGLQKVVGLQRGGGVTERRGNGEEVDLQKGQLGTVGLQKG